MLTIQNLHNAVSMEFTRFKREQTNRQDRIEVTEKLTEQYFSEHGEMPSASVLDRMATLILQDELADKHADKMTRNEYPLLSDRQRETRGRGERSLYAASDVATDGQDYRIKSRDSNRRMRECFG